MEYPKWSDIADLVGRLRERNDADSTAAVAKLDEYSTQLHRTMTELECLQTRMAQFGVLIEECSEKGELQRDSEDLVRAIVIPQTNWFRLLQHYRPQQEGLELKRELQQLREIAGVTAETLRVIDEWLGHASTRQAAMDSMWRLTRILESAGFRPPRENLKWRGQTSRAMEEAGVQLGEDGVLRLRRPQDKYWEPATGPAVADLLRSIADELCQ